MGASKNKINKMLNLLENYKINVTKNDLEAIENCKSWEDFDSCFDSKFQEKFLSNDDFYYRLEEETEDYKVYYIGNGLYGYEKDGKRYLDIYDLEAYQEVEA